eukprot:8615373-Prorocentrum_lima.AAC.1
MAAAAPQHRTQSSLILHASPQQVLLSAGCRLMFVRTPLLAPSLLMPPPSQPRSTTGPPLPRLSL